jgi:hypothetical protein
VEPAVDAKKLMILASVAFVVFFTITSPTKSADIIHTTWRATVNIEHGVGNFVNNL